MDIILEKAYAKVNLGLDIIGKRSDGYHELSMIMHSIDLYDELLIKKETDGKRYYHTDSSNLKMDETNLVCRAAELFCQTYDVEEGFSVDLKKRIPMAAGLAGGSSDAAATLRGLNRLFEKNVSLAELAALGNSLGADVPYCVFGKTALAEGTGEKLRMLSDLPKLGYLLVKPDVGISTKWAYDMIDKTLGYEHPDIVGIAEAIQCRNTEKIFEKMGNSFESVIIPVYPVIGEIKKIMEENGAKKALMSGSGSAVFGIYDNPDKMKKTEEKIKLLNTEFFYKIW